ncbi:MAG: hypothetical protein MGG37_21110 [Trichodesmium sp. MAG_R01]|nr:hypothetical protein [Trichodesmium sp. MAG_R01]
MVKLNPVRRGWAN